MSRHEPLNSRVFDLLQEIVGKSFEGDYIYRGEPKNYTRISSTLYRQYEETIDTEHFDIENAQKEMLEQVRAYTSFSDETDILTELQHFGGKTNLIDFTSDYLIALFFACDSSFTKDGRIVLLDKASRPQEIKSPKKNQNSRVISQKSIFVQASCGYIDENSVKIVSIPADLKKVALDYLTKHHGISTETIYNDVFGYIQNQEKHQPAYAEFYIAYTYLNRDEFEKAKKHYDKAIELNPLISAYVNRAAAKHGLGCHRAAIADCNIALRFDQRDAFAYYYRGLARKSLEEYEDAVEDLRQAKTLAQEQGPEDLLIAINKELNDLKLNDSNK